MDKTYILYNLEFPTKINTLNLDDYSLERLPEYSSNYQKMMWLVNSNGSEFATHENTGSHQQTAKVRNLIRSLTYLELEVKVLD